MKLFDYTVSQTATVGFDIEFALLNTKGRPVSAIPYLRGTKKRPQDVMGGNIQRDNIAFEIAVDYSTNWNDLIDGIRDILQYGISMLPKGYKLSCIPSATYDPKELKHAEAKEFGCDADYDAKTGFVNEFDGIVDPNFRSFGFHVHTGYSREQFEARTHVLVSDLVLGLFSTMKDNSEAALARRQLYGKPSCYRLKDYGVEYRTLSNYFCKSPRLIKAIYVLNRLALCMSVKYLDIYYRSVDMYEVSDVIMSGNTARATEIFFKHFHKHIDPTTQRWLIDELEYDNYKSLEEEWCLDYSVQKRTTHEALRADYYVPPTVKEIIQHA